MEGRTLLPGLMDPHMHAAMVQMADPMLVFESNGHLGYAISAAMREAGVDLVSLGVFPSFLIGHIRWWGTAFRDRLLGPGRAMENRRWANTLTFWCWKHDPTSVDPGGISGIPVSQTFLGGALRHGG